MTQTGLKRSLGVFSCIFFGVGSILGAGIYALIGKVAGQGGNITWLGFLIAAITALLTAMSYAEMSKKYPSAGGEYVYAKNTIGKKAGFALGSIISLNGIISGATVAIGFAGYFSQLLNVPDLISSIGIILLIFFINILGIRESSMTNILFTIIEISGLLFVIYTCLPYFGKVNYLELPPSGMQGLFTAASLSFFAFIGFEEIVKLAEETKNPRRNIPLALFSASAIVIVLYISVSMAVVSAVPYQELGNSKSPFADIVGSRFGNTAIVVISVVALFSTANTILSNMLGSSRVILNMARENKKIKRLAYVSDRFKTPVIALVLIALIMTAFAMIGKIQAVAQIGNVFIYITFTVVNLSLIILRIKEKNKRIPFHAYLGILMTLTLMTFSLLDLI